MKWRKKKKAFVSVVLFAYRKKKILPIQNTLLLLHHPLLSRNHLCLTRGRKEKVEKLGDGSDTHHGVSLRWTLPFGAGTSPRARSYPGVGTLPYSFRESQRGEHPRAWRECLGPAVRIKLDSGQSVCPSPWERDRQSPEYFKHCPGQRLLREKRRARLCQLSCFRKGLAERQEEPPCVWKARSSSCREVQHSWRGQGSTGTAPGELGQHKLQGLPLKANHSSRTAREWRKIIPKRAQLPPGSGPLTWRAT